MRAKKPKCSDCHKKPAIRIIVRSVDDDRGMEYGGFYNEYRKVCAKCIKKYEN